MFFIHTRLRRVGAAIIAGLILSANAALAEDIIVRADRVIAVPGETTLEEASIHIRDGVIEAVSEGEITVEGAQIIDLGARTVVPGYIDSHVHIMNEWSRRQKLKRVELSAPDRALQATVYAKRTLMAGFTTIRDVGEPDNDAVFALRDALNANLVQGPRLFASGATITPTGGHADLHGFRRKVLSAFVQGGVCDGVDDCRRAVRERVKYGADHIKITATGGVLSETAAGTEIQFFEDELRAIVETAHLLNRKVTAHAHGKSGIDAALRAGIDSIEHGTYMDAESIRLFRRSGAYLVPTALAGATVAEWADEGDILPEPSAKKAAEVGPEMKDMLARAYEGGVKIAFGTDSGVSEHGDNGREFLIMAEAGMSLEDILIAATLNAADNMGKADSLGRIAPGYKADIVGLTGNPLETVEHFNAVDFVMRDGIVHKRNGEAVALIP